MNKRNIKRFRKDLRKGKALVGGWIQISNSNIAEIMSNANYSWIAFDMEHGSFSIGDLPDLFRSVEISNKLPLVRLPNKNSEICGQALDAGCAGVIIPNIKNDVCTITLFYTFNSGIVDIIIFHYFIFL